MTEEEAVKHFLIMSGFIHGGETFFFRDDSKVCYIPTKIVVTFDQVIEYMKTFSFYKFCNNEERLVYYRTAHLMRGFKVKYLSSQMLK